MLRFAALSAMLFVVGSLVRLNAPQSLLGILQGIGFLGLASSGVVYAFWGFRSVSRRLLWKVRNKLLISFTFVAVVPVVILTVIAWFSISLIFRQLSVVYLENEFGEISEKLHRRGEQVILRFYQSETASEARLRDLVKQERDSYVELEPGLSDASFVLLRKEVSRNSTIYRNVFSWPEQEDAPTPIVPHWARDGFAGMVVDGEQVHFRSLLPVKSQRTSYLVLVDLPFNRKLIDQIKQETEIADLQMISSAPDLAISQFFSTESRFLNLRWAHVLEPTVWEEGVNPSSAPSGLLLEVPVEALVSRYFTQTTGFGPFIIALIMILGVVFVVVEIGSLIIGVAIARSITRSIHQIDAGARNIRAGNFEFRIPSRNRDQLDSMATAFNEMSESIVELMIQVSEKERLEKEIEIAREVQTHLFPQELPRIPRLQLAGTCLPARSVSGDYYDFIPYGDRSVDIMIADISGKGISAALLMASLQSSFRSHVIHQNLAGNSDGISDAVATLNHQLYQHTSPEKFATLVLARVDAQDLSLTYCNAGHNPPLLVSNGSVTRLSTGGIVAGIFANPEYEKERIPLQKGDVVTFYTDGVVEAENPRGDQFGEEQLEELVKTNAFLTADDIRALILDEVSDWIEGREQRDDVTVVTLKVDWAAPD